MVLIVVLCHVGGNLILFYFWSGDGIQLIFKCFSLAHRDIKTANFLVGPDNTCVLSDFDLSLNLDTWEEGCSLRQVTIVVF